MELTKNSKIYCFFEQSGTFKNEWKKLGYEAEDYDILNDFGQTDNVRDLFAEINKAYEGEPSLFDEITENDLVMAFFPCVRFEDQILLHFRGETYQYKDWDLEKKLEYDLQLHTEQTMLYDLVTKLAIISLRKGFGLIVENPYSTQHHLTLYWAAKPAMIDNNRRDRGDYYTKPTQYWFFNIEKQNNLIFEPLEYAEYMTIKGQNGKNGVNKTVMRSMIHPQYASRFIREFVIKEGETK